MRKVLFPLLLLADAAGADTVFAVRNLPAQTVIGPADVFVQPLDVPGAETRLDDVIGREARMTIYKDRPVLVAATGAPTIVQRNQVVPLIYQTGSLVIQAEGRALDRAGIGETIRVMNLASRQTVSGRIRADGTIAVGSATTTFLAN